jgi:hypothetical protein
MAKGKKPSLKSEPHPSKQPAAIPPVDYKAERPSWRVSRMLMVHQDFGWRDIDAAQLERLRTRLKSFESMTWREILHPPQRHPQNHLMRVDHICKPAQELLEAEGLADIEQLVSLRIGQAERIWGILQAGVLLILWWDPNHLVYPMNLANN